MIASASPREIVRSSRTRERERETGTLKGAEEGGPCSSCQTRVMDISHCGKLTNTPWRPSDEHARPHTSLQFTCRARTRKRALPTRDKHERVYAGSLPRERNEMKRLYHRATLVQRSIPPATPALPSSTLFFPPLLFGARARARVRVSSMLDRRANDDRPSDACVHTCASTHSGSSLMLAHSMPHVCTYIRHCAGVYRALYRHLPSMSANICDEFVANLFAQFLHLI